MGYYSRFGGTIAVAPPARLPVEPTHVADSRSDDDDFCVEYETARRPVTVDVEGRPATVTVLEIVGLKSRWEDESKSYEFAQHLAHAAKHLLAENPDVKFSGYIEREGEENGDMARYYVNPDGSVETVEPTISWPDR